MLKLDLGCGTAKAMGFYGVDRLALPGVDEVADLDTELPFRSNSADLVYASHSLEHVRDLSFTIRQIYRVLCHGGQLCIVAPYSEQKLNLANPYHLSLFNEHTPRFWTTYPSAEVNPDEYAHPHAKHWGLLASDNSTPDIDLRLADMEFFYFPQYLRCGEHERRSLRQNGFDVCDQILYRLIAWKPAESNDDRPYEAHLREFVPYESALIWNRRKADQQHLRVAHGAPLQAAGTPNHVDGPAIAQGPVAARDRAPNELVPLVRTLVDGLLASRETVVSSLRAEITAANALVEEYRGRASEVTGLIAREAEASTRISSLRALVDELKAETIGLSQALGAKDAEANGRISTLRAEIEVGDALLEEYRGRTSELERYAQDLERKVAAADSENESSRSLDDVLATVSNLYNEVVAYRGSRAQRVAYRLLPDRVWPIVANAFPHLKAYSERRLRSRGYRLILSPDLRRMEYREYKMPVPARRLTTVELAIIPIFRSKGQIGVELVSATGQIEAQSVLPLENVSPDVPARFSLPDRPSLSPRWALRVFTRGATSPVAVYELVHPAPFRRRPLIRAFAALAEDS